MLRELQLVLSQIRPVSKLFFLAASLLRVAICGTDTFKTHQDVEEGRQVLLCL